MVSDDERREVARRLRGLHLGGGSKDLIERTLSDAIGAWRKSGMSWDFITERLADLIEPSDHIGDSDKMVDREALLALAKVLGGMGDRYNEHERYELGTTFKAIADRIREACGEVVR